MRYFPILFILLALIRCANIIPPEGGPRDTIPPSLIKSVPANNSRNFSGEKITLEFNEWITLKNPKEEIIITPSMGKGTKYLFKKNIATILPELQLDSSTTYSISFRDVIQDLNEGNPAEGLKLAFSTGTVIDSLKIYGTAFLAIEGTPVEKLNVAVYSADTFNITKHTPSYISRSDKKGRFNITNLKPGNYYVYAWEDKNKNLKVETNSERFGTYPEIVRLPEQKDSIRIPLVKLDSRELKLNNYRNISNYSIIRLNKAPVNYQITSEKKVTSHFSAAKNEIIAYPPLKYPDSVLIRFEARDSLENTIDTTFFIKQTKSKPIKETFTARIENAKYTASIKKFEATIEYSLPLQHVNPDSIIILLDTIYFTGIKKEDVRVDSIKNKLSIEKIIDIPDTLVSKGLNLSLRKPALISMFSDTLKVTDQKIIPKVEKDLSIIVLKSEHKKENWIIEVVNEKYDVLQTQPHNKTLTFKNMDPVNTKIRAYHDLNSNRKWDINNPLGKKPPEEYIYYKNEKGQTGIPLRANWTVELQWDFK